MDIEFNVNNQHLEFDSPFVVADTINYINAKFNFKSDDWDGVEKWAHFRQSNMHYDVKLIDDEAKSINLTKGLWQIYLHGNVYEAGVVVQRITTEPVLLDVKGTGMLGCGFPFPEVTPSIIEQLLAMMSDVLTKHNEDEYTPTGPYNPATKKYVDDNMSTADKIFVAKYGETSYEEILSAFNADKLVFALDGHTVFLLTNWINQQKFRFCTISVADNAFISTDCASNGWSINRIYELQSKIDELNKLAAELIEGLSAVALTGDYNDLLNKPGLAQIFNLVDGDKYKSMRSTGSIAPSGTYSMGMHAVSLGNDTKASGNFAFAGGSKGNAQGNSSVAIGIHNDDPEITSTAFATGEGAIAIGNDVVASGKSAIAIGDSAEASYQHAVAIGKRLSYYGELCAKGQYAIAMGASVGAYGLASNATNIDNMALMYGTHAEGGGTIAGVSKNEATLPYRNRHAREVLPYYDELTTAQKEKMGYVQEPADTYADIEVYSHAEGLYTDALGMGSHAEGRNCRTIGKFSHAGGAFCKANEPQSFAHGEYLEATSDDQFVVGRYNYYENDSSYHRLFAVGCGSPSERKNALSISEDGTMRIIGIIYVGCNADSTGGTPISPADIAGWNNAVKSVNGKTGKDVVLNGTDIKLTTNQQTIEANMIRIDEELNRLEDDKADVVIVQSADYIVLGDSMSTAVPALTAQQITSIYADMLAGKLVRIKDALGNNGLSLTQAVLLDEKKTLYALYLDRLVLTYQLNNGNVSVLYNEISHISQNIYVTKTVTFTAGSTTATVAVTGVTADNNIIVSPAPASVSAWSALGAYCSAQSANSLTFTALNVPSTDTTVTANIIIMR